MDDEQLRQVRITADQAAGTVVLDGRDISSSVVGYELRQLAGRPPELVLFLSQLGKDEFDGLARVVVGVPPDPSPAAAVFLGAIDARELERHTLARHDLMDGGPNELTRAMLRILVEWASGKWEPEVADAVLQ
ncbi:hypothetical protein [Streptomyces olivochromogenes]|uniref:hypothetical protein n=1 Tax=Streptomyces olivochromogenes TaxID=1963 RepID=UPI0036B0319F